MTPDWPAITKKMYYYALKVCRCPDRAHDLVGNALLSTLLRWPKIVWAVSAEETLMLYLCKAVLNRYINEGRSRSRRWEVQLQDKHLDLQSVPSAEQEVINRSERRRWLQAVSCLPPGMRRSYVLVVVQEMAYRDAAAQLGVPIGTVKSGVHKARRKLQESLTSTTE